MHGIRLPCVSEQQQQQQYNNALFTLDTRRQQVTASDKTKVTKK